MGKGLDQEKRRAWVANLERFRASGLTIAKFCENEKVSVQTFHYWARRIRSAEPSAGRATSCGAPAPVQAVSSPRVHFQFSGGVKVSIPADCLEAIRCLVQCIQPSSPAPVSFHQVLLRDPAQEVN